MGLGDVSQTTIPKLTIVSPPQSGGHLNTRTFIPHRCHDAIGVLGAVSVSTAALLPGSPAYALVDQLNNDVATDSLVRLEHPTGVFEAVVEIVHTASGEMTVKRAGIIRTARKLMDGIVFPRSE
jgi:4-oxalomesaconate tautomerase